MNEPHPMDRRQFVVGMSVGIGGAAFKSADGQSTPWWRFFTQEEALLVDAVAEQIIPADQDPGAHDTGVVHFIDRQLVGHYEPYQAIYRQGLVGLQETSRARFGQPFLKLSWEQQTEVLRALESGTAAGETWQTQSSREFFRLIRDHSMQGFYGSPRHGGNRNYASYRMLGLDYPQIIGRQRPLIGS